MIEIIIATVASILLLVVPFCIKNSIFMKSKYYIIICNCYGDDREQFEQVLDEFDTLFKLLIKRIIQFGFWSSIIFLATMWINHSFVLVISAIVIFNIILLAIKKSFNLHRSTASMKKDAFITLNQYIYGNEYTIEEKKIFALTYNVACRLCYLADFMQISFILYMIFVLFMFVWCAYNRVYGFIFPQPFFLIT